MNKHKALHLILNFGRDEQIALIEAGKRHEAYQIEHARIQLHYALLESIKACKIRLEFMTTRYYGHSEIYIADDHARELLIEFKKKFQ